MTKMKRMSVSFSDETAAAIVNLRKTDEFARCTYSEIIRRLVLQGLDKFENDESTAEIGKSGTGAERGEVRE